MRATFSIFAAGTAGIIKNCIVAAIGVSAGYAAARGFRPIFYSITSFADLKIANVAFERSSPLLIKV